MKPTICGDNAIYVPSQEPCTDCERFEHRLDEAEEDIVAVGQEVNALNTYLNNRIDNIITSPAPSEQEIIDARIGVDGKVYDSLGTSVRNQINKVTNDFLAIEPSLDISWTIGKTIGSDGSESKNVAGAMSSGVAVEGGNLVTRPYPVTDAGGVNIIIHVCQYKNGVFQSRTSLTATNGLTLASDTTSVRFNCSRSVSSGIVMTQADVDTYFRANLHRKYDLLSEKQNKLKSVTITEAIAEADYEKLLSNLPANVYAWTSASWWIDAPANGLFYILNLRAISRTSYVPTEGQGTQVAIYPNSGAIYMRRNSASGWSDWVSGAGSNPKYIAFGDSLTWGAVWDSDQSTDLYQADYNDQIPTRIAHAIGSTSFINNGVSGARFVRQESDSDASKTIVERIKETSFSGVDLVTIGGGRNDSATALGSADTSTVNDGTICGAVMDALQYLTTNYPKLQIVMYGVTPQPTSTAHASSDIYTRVFSGGWSLNTYYQEISKVCAKYGVPFVDWYDCTLILRWGVLSGGYSGGVQNWSHPLDSDTYKQMGNYLAGKVSEYYCG